MDRLSYSEVVKRYRFDPVSACVPTDGIRRKGDTVEPLFPAEYVKLFSRCVKNGAVYA
jgi:hypothetical protein